MKFKSILVTGANGQLGSEFRQLHSAYPEFDFVFVSKDDLDITDEAAIKALFELHKFAYCINCAAYTAVDKAETEREAAIAINATAVGTLALVCAQNNARLIHYSTDYVFTGNATEPISTEVATAPLNFYGETKLAGENLALSNNPQSMIIRTSWVYSSYGKNFVKTMLRLMAEKESINVVADQVGSPTYAADLALATMHIITSGKFEPGIYHYSNKGIISWYDFAVAIGEYAQLPCKVNPIATTAYPTPAPRPAYSAMDTSKITTIYNLELPGWQESLQTCLEKIKADTIQQ